MALVEITLHHSTDGDLDRKLDLILARISEIHLLLHKVFSHMSQIDDELAALKQAVNDEATVEASAIALMNGIPNLISTAVDAALAAGATPVQLQAVTDLITQVQSQSGGLAAAVTTNTPAAPAPNPVPTEPVTDPVAPPAPPVDPAPAA